MHIKSRSLAQVRASVSSVGMAGGLMLKVQLAKNLLLRVYYLTYNNVFAGLSHCRSKRLIKGFVVLNNYLYKKMLVKKKVLIIENDQDIRHIVEFVLQEHGFETLSIPEPEDLSEIILFKPDVILLDEFINSKPGHRLCRKIKHVPALAAIPVIILSTANDIEIIAAECEANDHISKPFDVETMVDKVVRMVNHQPMAY